MALASAPVLIAAATPVSFDFALRKSVNAQVRFYTSVDATVGTELDAPAGGSRDVTASNVSNVTTADRATGATYHQPALRSAILNGVKLAMPAAEWREFLLGSGMTSLEFVAIADVDPGGALSYRIILDVEA